MSKCTKNHPNVLILDNDKLDYIETLILQPSTSNAPPVSAHMNGKGNSYNALFKCEGLRNKTMETLISNLIDHTLQHNFSEADKCRILIKQYKPDVYDKIIYAANSIIYNYDLIIS